MSNFLNRIKSRRALSAGILSVVLLVAVIGSVRLWWLPPRPGASWPSVSRSNLVMRAGSWFSMDGTNLFTGWMIERYPDGSLQSRWAISNGLLNGVCEGWHKSGRLKIREYFKNSVSDGLREKWFSSGQLESKAHIVNGKIVGTFCRWYENGQLAEQIEMEEGRPNGVAWEYYPSGFAKAKTQVNSGKVLDRKIWADRQVGP